MMTMRRRAGPRGRSTTGLAAAAIAVMVLAGTTALAEPVPKGTEADADVETAPSGEAAAAPDAAAEADSDAAPGYTIADVAWMSGHWVREEGELRTEELWMDPQDNMILGLSRTTAEGVVRAFEFLRVQLQSDDNVVYLAQPGGKEATPFRLVEVEGTRAVFENPDHDFPQRVTYERDGATMKATIGGQHGGMARSLGWEWTLAE